MKHTFIISNMQSLLAKFLGGFVWVNLALHVDLYDYNDVFDICSTSIRTNTKGRDSGDERINVFIHVIRQLQFQQIIQRENIIGSWNLFEMKKFESLRLEGNLFNALKPQFRNWKHQIIHPVIFARNFLFAREVNTTDKSKNEVLVQFPIYV